MNENDVNDDLRPEYDLSTLKRRVKGKYIERYNEGSNVVLLEPDVAKEFPNSEAVNTALRTLIGDTNREVRR
jgi:hypothetical protein